MTTLILLIFITGLNIISIYFIYKILKIVQRFINPIEKSNIYFDEEKENTRKVKLTDGMNVYRFNNRKVEEI